MVVRLLEPSKACRRTNNLRCSNNLCSSSKPTLYSKVLDLCPMPPSLSRRAATTGIKPLPRIRTPSLLLTRPTRITQIEVASTHRQICSNNIRWALLVHMINGIFQTLRVIPTNRVIPMVSRPMAIHLNTWLGRPHTSTCTTMPMVVPVHLAVTQLLASLYRPTKSQVST